ncbi:hypothetical protein [Enterococcus casseliflavus]|uniref:hypothetical protein n=1 Tax=Enterococcus casseliflavus TaxID=37734 RepID=UPI0022E1B2F7|nr:hypothetical protein [Enterococcus casseliflavus]
MTLRITTFSIEYTKEEEQLIADVITAAIESIRLHKKQMKDEHSQMQISRMDSECSQLQNLLYKCALRKQLLS